MWVGDLRTLRHRFQKFAVTGVHTYLISLRFQKFPLWRAFSKVCGYSVRFRRIRVDEGRIRNKMFADTNESGYVWTGPRFNGMITSSIESVPNDTVPRCSLLKTCQKCSVLNQFVQF